MALRVLLADESITIKKVFQLALQDFAVEVVAVNVGVDVVQVATKINPDIIFADVLLQKMSGYDVSRDIKSNPQLAHIPVVLIWSGFLDLDEGRYKSSGANAHLEKPFDTQRLRQLIQSLVPKTNTQPMSPFLKFPKLPDFTEKPSATRTQQTPPAQHAQHNQKPPLTPYPPPPTQPPNVDSWSMDSFESIDHTHIPPVPNIPSLVQPEMPPEIEQEDFVAVQLPSEPPPTRKPILTAVEKTTAADDGDGQWIQKTLTSFKLPPEKRKEDVPVVKYAVPEYAAVPEDDTDQELELDLSDEKPHTAKTEANIKTDAGAKIDANAKKETSELNINEQQILNISEQQIEAIIRAQTKEIIEKVVWQVVPEIATRIIERELERLLKEQKEL